VVDVVNSVADEQIISEPDDRYNFARGTGVGLFYGFTGDIGRNAGQLFQPRNVPVATQDEMDQQSVEGTFNTRRLVDNVFNISRPYDGSVVDEMALRYNVPPGAMTDRLHRAAELMPGDGDRRYEMVEILAERYGREAEEMSRVGPGANVAAAILDPASLATYLVAGAGVATTSARAAAAMRAGQSVNQVQRFAATRPFLFGGAVEGAVDAGLQGSAIAIDSSGQREFSVANLALAAVVGGSFNKVQPGLHPAQVDHT